MHKKLNKLKEQYNLGKISYSELIEQSYQLGLNDNESASALKASQEVIKTLLEEKKLLIDSAGVLMRSAVVFGEKISPLCT